MILLKVSEMFQTVIGQPSKQQKLWTYSCETQKMKSHILPLLLSGFDHCCLVGLTLRLCQVINVQTANNYYSFNIIRFGYLP